MSTVTVTSEGSTVTLQQASSTSSVTISQPLGAAVEAGQATSPVTVGQGGVQRTVAVAQVVAADVGQEAYLQAVEDIEQWDMVHAFTQDGETVVALADAALGRPAHGFAVSPAQVGRLCATRSSGPCYQPVAELGLQYLGTQGKRAAAPPGGAGTVVQTVGITLLSGLFHFRSGEVLHLS